MFSFDFQLTTGDQNKGTVYLPNEHATNLPVVIYCHGWGGSRHLGPAESALRDQAMKSNYALVAFDFYACGETGGDYRLMRYGRWKDNLAEVFAWCAVQPFANKTKIGCYSCSSGSMAALRFAAENHNIAFVISVGTAIHLVGVAKTLADHAAGLLVGEQHEFLGTTFGMDFFVDTVGNAPVHNLHNIQCPVLFLQGGNDSPWRCADARLGHDIMKRKNLPATYIEILGGNHGLENVPDEAVCHTFAWLSAVI